MENKISCAVIKDLLPTYLDELTSEESNQMIQAHINECNECRATLENMRAPEIDENQIEIEKKEIDFLKKNKEYLEAVLGITIGIAIFIVIVVLIFAFGRYSIKKRNEAKPANISEIEEYHARTDYEPANMSILDGNYKQISDNNLLSGGTIFIEDSSFKIFFDTHTIHSASSISNDNGDNIFDIMTYVYNSNHEEQYLEFSLQKIEDDEIAMYIKKSDYKYFKEGDIILFRKY